MSAQVENYKCRRRLVSSELRASPRLCVGVMLGMLLDESVR
ncbi:hypothetical protein RR48_05258 [Papilio machaon]|uniref:Uncharacterized protein n=1 Tax=Papilio machaon TaxID=76193 RepID=A0A0N0PCZ2_PAPMA|nr:hypothetical protein RR48_05258 [Papilio machaon]